MNAPLPPECVFKRNQSNLAARILDAFPAGSYALSGLLRLLDVVETEEVQTAAVECVAQPRLLINPRFVAEHANTSEKLLMLVMHELHHVLLGHTTLFPRTNPVQNFVFDTVINGICCRMFPGADYTRLFTDYYRADRFPECLLRPPPGWPAEQVGVAPGIAELPEPARALANEVHQALYSEAGASYHEVYKILPRVLNAGGGSVAGIPLIGDHSGTLALEQQSPLLFDVVSDLVGKWPQPPNPIRGRALSDVIKSGEIAPKPTPTNRAILRRLILKVARTGASGRIRRIRPSYLEAPSPIPNLARRSIVLRALGVPTLLHPGKVPWPQRVPAGERVHVYLDVSGSMDSVLPALYGAVLDCADYVHPDVHLFSNSVADMTLSQLRAGKCKTTGGTDVDCVANHMRAQRITSAVLITDGYVGKPQGGTHTTLANARLAVAYLGQSTNQNDLSAVANHTNTLNIGVKK